MRCPNCSEENPDRFRMCGYCGTPLTGALAPSELRKTVTILFSDLKGSTDLGERLDPESLREVLTQYFAQMKQIIERHGGTVEKYIGDAIMAVFGIPRLHEDDALRAVRAAAEMRQALVVLNLELEGRWGVRLTNRTGVNTGEVVTGDATSGQRLVTGDTVNVAARLEQAAPENDVLIGGRTWRLTRDAVEVEAVEPLSLKGKSERVPAYRLLSVRADRSEGFARLLDSPLVGRAEELAILDRSFLRAQDERRCRLVTVFGHAGLGKTRLVDEFLARTAREADALRGRCVSYGDGITFAPFAEIVRQAAKIAEDEPVASARAKLEALVPGQPDVVARLAAILGLSHEPFAIRETFWAARKMMEELARRRPLVVVVEDIHWAEPTLLDLIQHVVETAEDAPLLVVCPARPELLEDRPRWMEGDERAESILLTPLSEEETGRVAQELLGRAGLPPEVCARVTQAAEGNPLFAEQMVSMLVDQGSLTPDEAGGWAVGPGPITVPPTISALLSARLDRLGREERAVLEAGSIPGAIFHRGAVAYLTPDSVRAVVDDDLRLLTGKLLIARVPPNFVEDDAYRFQHILIREAAYDAQLKRVRADLHERYVEWLEQAVGQSNMHLEETVGYHLEQAYRYRVDLAPPDERSRRLGARAASELAVAGRRALERGDMPAAANLLDRAIALLPEDDPGRIDLGSDLGDAYIELGRFQKADETVGAAIDLAMRLGRAERAPALRILRLSFLRATDPSTWNERVLEETATAIPVLEAQADHAALARAWRQFAAVHGSANRYAAAEEAARRAVEEARLAGDHRNETRGMHGLALSALLGPTSVPEAIALCERLIAQAAGDQRIQAILRVFLAQLRAMQGDLATARELYASGRSALEDLGVVVLAAATSLYGARIEMLAGEAARAEAMLRADYERLRKLGERYFTTTIAAVLADALVEQGRDDEADAFVKVTERTATQEDVDAQFRWRLVRARLLANEKRSDEAIALAREAVDLMRRTDAIAKLGGSLLVLVGVLRRAGRDHEALEPAREALRLFTAKGDLVSTEQVRAIIVELESMDAPSREPHADDLLLSSRTLLEDPTVP